MMQDFTTAGRTYRFQWVSDQAFDGLRLEALHGAEVVLDVSVPAAGPVTGTRSLTRSMRTS
jgi:hypothetical protein